LRVVRQKIGILQDDGFKQDPAIVFDVCLCEEFEIFANEFDAFPAMSTIDKHDIGFHNGLVVIVNLVQKFEYDRPLAGSGRSVENNVRDFFRRNERIEFTANTFVDGQHHVLTLTWFCIYRIMCIRSIRMMR